MESIGIKLGVLIAVLAGLAELVGGLLFAAGFLTPVAAALILVKMLGAIFKVHLANGFWVDKGGIEYPIVLAIVAIAIALIGPGAYSLG